MGVGCQGLMAKAKAGGRRWQRKARALAESSLASWRSLPTCGACQLVSLQKELDLPGTCLTGTVAIVAGRASWTLFFVAPEFQKRTGFEKRATQRKT